MKKTSSFSLIELLVALSILAIVAAIIVPKYLNARKQAAVAVMTANIKTINETINNWMLAGGTIATDSWGQNGVSWVLPGALIKFLALTPPRASVTISDPWAYMNPSFTVSDTSGYPGSSSVQMNLSVITSTYNHLSFVGGAAPSSCKTPNTFYLTSDSLLYYIDTSGLSHMAIMMSESGTFTFAFPQPYG